MNVIQLHPKERKPDEFSAMCQQYLSGDLVSLYVTAVTKDGEVRSIEIRRHSDRRRPGFAGILFAAPVKGKQ